MHYLITGHTGFKGAWLSLILKEAGHTVSGLSLEPLKGGLFDLSDLSKIYQSDLRVDIRNAELTKSAIESVEPDVVFHLAAQPLVRQSYLDPRETFETNAMGTLNVLEGVASTSSVKAHVVITTDKVYRNINQSLGYVESDPLGGDDPYSSSKAMADLLTQSWVKSFPGIPTAIARAGNVIGGGDVSPDRLLPDLIRSFTLNKKTILRFPDAVRPWQHVLDCLQGYIQLSNALLEGQGQGQWNIGPEDSSFQTVRTIADEACNYWGNGVGWEYDGTPQPHEAHFLTLNPQKAISELGWRNVLQYPEALHWTLDWEKRVSNGESPYEVTQDQISKYLAKV